MTSENQTQCKESLCCTEFDLWPRSLMEPLISLWAFAICFPSDSKWFSWVELILLSCLHPLFSIFVADMYPVNRSNSTSWSHGPLRLWNGVLVLCFKTCWQARNSVASSQGVTRLINLISLIFLQIRQWNVFSDSASTMIVLISLICFLSTEELCFQGENTTQHLLILFTLSSL